MFWTQAEAIELCRLVEPLCPAFGCHVALTGGLLYKDGPRKDCDLLFYRIRRSAAIDVVGLFDSVLRVGLVAKSSEERFVIKATWRGKPVDCLFPEAASGDYSDDAKPSVGASTAEELRGWSP